MYDKFDLRCDGDELRLISDRLLATIERDQAHGLVRVRLPDGYTSAPVDLTTARDAAITLALGSLNVVRHDRPAV
jgi:hypothetical protein